MEIVDDSANLTSRTVHGLKWSYLSTIINGIIQVGFTAVMARLLAPSAFGLVAMMEIAFRADPDFAQTGIGCAIIQMRDFSEENVGESLIARSPFD